MSNTMRSAQGPCPIRTRSMNPVDMPGAERGSEPQASTGQPVVSGLTTGPPPASAKAGTAQIRSRSSVRMRILRSIGPPLLINLERDIHPADTDQALAERGDPEFHDLV